MNGFAANAGKLLVGHSGRLAIQAAYFVVLARGLGADGFGIFLSMSALVAVFSPFSGCGAGNLLVRDTARMPSAFFMRWQVAMGLLLTSGLPIVLLSAGVGTVLYGSMVGAASVLALCAADAFLARTVDIAAQAFQAFERLGRMAQLQVTLALARLAAALVLFASGGGVIVIRTWTLGYLVATAVACAFSLYIVKSDLGGTGIRLPTRQDVWDGHLFSASVAAQNVHNNIDKPIVAQLIGAHVAGTYGAAYRIIDVCFMPISALMYSAYAAFFRCGERGARDASALAMKLAPGTLLFSIAAGAALYVLAPVLPLILGSSFLESVPALKWISLLLPLRAGAVLAGDVLTASGGQGSRVAVQWAVAALAAACLLPAVSAQGWRGAAFVSLIAEAALGLSLALVVKRKITSQGAPVAVAAKP